MRKIGIASVLLLSAACHDRGHEGPPRGAHAAVLKPECDTVRDEGPVLLSYDGVGAQGFTPGYVPKRCPASGACGPETAVAGDCALHGKSTVSITGLRPDGIVGTVRRFDGGLGGCRDGVNVWIPRGDFNREEGFKLAADFFIDPHCADR
jgi:hypothetical protein